jgi:hypothetical protein
MYETGFLSIRNEWTMNTSIIEVIRAIDSPDNPSPFASDVCRLRATSGSKTSCISRQHAADFAPVSDDFVPVWAKPPAPTYGFLRRRCRVGTGK